MEDREPNPRLLFIILEKTSPPAASAAAVASDLPTGARVPNGSSPESEALGPRLGFILFDRNSAPTASAAKVATFPGVFISIFNFLTDVDSRIRVSTSWRWPR